MIHVLNTYFPVPFNIAVTAEKSDSFANFQSGDTKTKV